MRYEELMRGIPYRVLRQEGPKNIESLSYDSRKVMPGACCVCEKGLKHDGLDFLEEIRSRGAVAVVVDREPVHCVDGLTLIEVDDIRRAMPRMAANFYHGCLDDIRVTGITGTNGKTTTSTLMYHILMEGSRKSGLIGTNENCIGYRREAADHTTPMPFDLFALFQRMKQEEIKDIVMEVSSHALDQHRVDTVPFQLGIFTNLTQDHLDYHKTMEEYRRAKTKLFQQSEMSLLNGDDPAAEKIQREAQGTCYRYGLEKQYDFSARNIEMSAQGIAYDWYSGSKRMGKIRYPIPGRFNIYNTLAAASGCRLLGIEEEKIIEALNIKEPIVAGRFQTFCSRDGVTVIVDYAHTPDGLQNVLETIQEFAKGRIMTVFGCGGDRDAEKRPIMGRIAGEFSDYCVLTSDNPRWEDPEAILSQIEEGVRKTGCPYRKEQDRVQAIETAIREALPMDVILIAGKGHETYQIVQDVKLPLDDREEARRALEKRSA